MAIHSNLDPIRIWEMQQPRRRKKIRATSPVDGCHLPLATSRVKKKITWSEYLFNEFALHCFSPIVVSLLFPMLHLRCVEASAS